MDCYQIKSTRIKQGYCFNGKRGTIVFVEEYIARYGETLESLARLEMILDDEGEFVCYERKLSVDEKFRIAIGFLRSQKINFRIRAD